MIKVSVKNFQSLKDVQVVIQGLTVITGTNNAGKSALLRAIYSACINARGTHFVRKGAKFSSVHLVFEDGEFLWEKGAKDNRYVVNGLVIDKVSHGAPKEVQDFGVRAIQAGNVSLWPQVAHQAEGMVFLFNQSGAVMAEAVADVDRVGILTKGLRIAESEARSSQEQLKIRRSDAASLLVRRSLLDPLEGIKKGFVGLQERQATHDRTRKTLQDLREDLVKMRRFERLKVDLGGVECIEVPEAGRLEGLKKTATKIKVLGQIKGQWESLCRYVAQWSGVKSLDVAPLAQGLFEVKKLESALSALRRLQLELETAFQRIQRDDQTLVLMEKELGDLREKMKICPTCQRPLEGIL